MELLKKVLKDIKPSKEEEKEVKDKITNFLKRVNKGLKDAKAELGGSGAKETWLSHAHDADVFVGFNYNKYKDKSDQLSDILEKHLKKIFGKVSRLHGSRDYFQIKERGFTFEIVPILKIKNASDAKNITDVSPLHAAWVKKHKKYADDIRLTKQFCKAQGIYGAESYIKGFSGYICEILTVYYKGFIGLIKNASKWKEKVFIDVEKYYRNKKEILDKLNLSKIYSPLVIIDPVQKDRNAAAAVSEEKFREFVCVCREFLSKASEDFFEVKEVSVDELKERAGKDRLILLDVTALPGKEDVVGSKLLKSLEFIEKELIKKEFKIYEKGWKWDKAKKALFWLVVDKKLLSENVEKQGPPVNLKEHAANFKKQYKGKTFTKKGRIFAKVKREFCDVSKLVKDLIKNKYVKEKIKTISFS